MPCAGLALVQVQLAAEPIQVGDEFGAKRLLLGTVTKMAVIVSTAIPRD